MNIKIFITAAVGSLALAACSEPEVTTEVVEFNDEVQLNDDGTVNTDPVIEDNTAN